MHWIKGAILFPARAKIFRVSEVFLRKAEVPSAPQGAELDEDSFTEWLEGIFTRVKALKYLPEDSQLVAAGMKQGYSAIFLTVSSNEFEPVKDGERYQEEVLVWREN